MSKKKKRDLPIHLDECADQIWDDMGIEFDDDELERSDLKDKDRLLRMFREEDEEIARLERRRKWLERQKRKK